VKQKMAEMTRTDVKDDTGKTKTIGEIAREEVSARAFATARLMRLIDASIIGFHVWLRSGFKIRRTHSRK
jgi:hypothetical protein